VGVNPVSWVGREGVQEARNTKNRVVKEILKGRLQYGSELPDSIQMIFFMELPSKKA
jgi:hypothetical protein